MAHMRKQAALYGAVLGLSWLGHAQAAGADKLAAAAATPPVAQTSPVAETLWGQKVTDPYRAMETLDQTTLAWMKAQGDYTRTVLDAIEPRAALEQRIADFTGSFGVIDGYVRYGGRAFYEERAPGSDNFDLMEKDASGARKLVDVAALRAAQGGTPLAINFFLVSPDGAKVAVGISAGGSENASITVYDAATGAQVAGPIDRAEPGATAWSDDGARLYFTRLKQLAPGQSDIEKYKDQTLDTWDLHGEPTAILGAAITAGPKFMADEQPSLLLYPGSSMAVAVNQNGVQNELALWLAPAGEVTNPAAWRPFVTRADDINNLDMRGEDIFLLSHKGAPTFQVLTVKSGQPLSAATVLLPARPDRVIDAVHAAADGLYVLTREGAYSQLLRIPAGKTAAETITLPLRGHIRAAFTDPRAPGIAITLESWVVAPVELAYDPAAKAFTDLGLGTKPALDPAQFTVQDLQARAHDGVQVPLSLVQPAAAHGPQITLVEAYGSYGISNLARFSTRAVSFLREGGSYASCHVRGGGELGEAWRLGGKDANKPNTWRDLIACSEDLIARGITTKDKLFIFGGSAGGITMGRALTERPDLFAGVLDAVPAANTLRAEFSPNGPPNIPEFGTVTDKAGFANLFAMDSIQHVKPGVQYPAVLIMTGLNDPRVSPWEPAKFAAALQASGTAKPVLLRIDPAAGHGIGSTKSQNDQVAADMYSFVFWRAGRPGWRPAAQ